MSLSLTIDLAQTPDTESVMSALPYIAVSPEAQKHILKKGGYAILSRSPKAGRQGYPSDSLVVSCIRPEDRSSYHLVESQGITFYLDPKLTVENYEQLNVWLKVQMGIIKQLKARITLYRRIDLS